MAVSKLERFRREAAYRLKKTLNTVEPYARVVASATDVVGRLAKPTPLSVANAVTQGLSTLATVLDPNKDTGTSPDWSYDLVIEPGAVIKGLQQLGAQVLPSKRGWHVTHSGGAFTIVGNYAWFMDSDGDPVESGSIALIGRAITQYLPQRFKLSSNRDKKGETTQIEPLVDTPHTPPGTDAIAARLVRLAGGGKRSILLEGRPGIGKTTMAQAIIQRLPGTAVLVDPSALGTRAVSLFTWFKPDALVIDDIDKISGMSTRVLEALIGWGRLVILTANNGRYDTVLDAALSRPGRIDEVFTVKAEVPFKRPPFDKLSDKAWAEVSEWPIAYLNELEKRLIHTPDDVRIGDLAARMKMRTRSGDQLLEAVSDDAEPDWWAGEEPCSDPACGCSKPVE